jgi:hypothetical protein
MAEIELSVLQRQCLDRRLGERMSVEREVAVWTALRNAGTSAIDWQLTTADARITLKRLYPAYQVSGVLGGKGVPLAVRGWVWTLRLRPFDCAAVLQPVDERSTSDERRITIDLGFG